MDGEQYISASEIGDYVFCKRGWWLRIHGKLKTTDAMLAGTVAHDSLFARLASIIQFQNILIWSGVVILILIILLLIFI